MAAKTDNVVAPIIGICAVVAALVLFGNWMNDNMSDDAEPGSGPVDPLLLPDPEDDRKLVILTVAWGQFRDNSFVGDEREITITYWVDGDRHSAVDRDDDSGSTWTEYLVVPDGTEIELLAEQGGTGGFLMCSIAANGKTLFPDGYMHRNDAGDCRARGIVE